MENNYKEEIVKLLRFIEDEQALRYIYKVLVKIASKQGAKS